MNQSPSRAARADLIAFLLAATVLIAMAVWLAMGAPVPK